MLPPPSPDRTVTEGARSPCQRCTADVCGPSSSPASLGEIHHGRGSMARGGSSSCACLVQALATSIQGATCESPSVVRPGGARIWTRSQLPAWQIKGARNTLDSRFCAVRKLLTLSKDPGVPGALASLPPWKAAPVWPPGDGEWGPRCGARPGACHHVGSSRAAPGMPAPGSSLHARDCRVIRSQSSKSSGNAGDRVVNDLHTTLAAQQQGLPFQLL